MERIDFIKPELRNGLNYTVRFGDKWLKRLKIGDHILLGETGGGIVAHGIVTDILYARGDSLPARVYEFEHDAECRVSGGLCSAMVRAYPALAGGGFWTAFCTVIGFVPISYGPELRRPPARSKVYDLIDGEIAYAKSKWDDGTEDNSWPDKDKPVECWLSWMASYLLKANDSATCSADKTLALDNVRKLAGLAVNCMTYHKTRSREEEHAAKKDN